MIEKFLIYDSAYENNQVEESPLVESDPYLFKKIDIGTMFFVIKNGNVEIELENIHHSEENSRQNKIYYGRGDSFGELSLLYKTVRSASVRCLGKCTFLCMSSQVFR